MRRTYVVCVWILLLVFIWTPFIFAYELAGIDIHAFVSQGYLKSDDNNYLADTKGDGTFQFNEFGINFSKSFDKLRLGIQLLSRDLGKFGNNDVTVDWALGDYRFFDPLGIRAGKIKMPMGLYNEERDLDFLRVPIFLPSSIYDEGARDFQSAFLGGEIYGSLDAKKFGEFDYEIFGGQHTVDDDSLYWRDITHMYTLWGKLDDYSFENEILLGGALRWLTPLPGLRAGFSYLWTRDELNIKVTTPSGPMRSESEVDPHTFWVASLEYTWKNLKLVGEYSQLDADMTTTMTSSFGAVTSDAKTKQEGWYVMANYQFTDWFTAGLYYSEFYPDRTDRDGDRMSSDPFFPRPDYYAWKKEWVPTLRFDITDHWVIKGELHFVNGAAQLYDFNNPDGREKHWILFALKTTFYF